MAENESARIKQPILDEIATTQKDIDLFSGYLGRLENPDPVLRSEAGGKGLKLYDEVARDAHAGSVLDTRALAVVGKDWAIVRGKSGIENGTAATTDLDEEIACFVEDALNDANFDQARRDLLKSVLYGVYFVEVIWKYSRDKSAVVVDRFIGKHPRRFTFTYDRVPRLLTIDNMIEGEALPERKFVWLTFGDSDNPWGSGLGQSIWWPVWFKKHGIKFWLIFLEKFGQPTVVGKYPAGTPKDKQNELLDAVKMVHAETGVKIPATMTIELLEAARSGQASYQEMCEYMDRSVSKRVLGQTATTEGTAGKLGNEESQDNVRQDLMEADADLLDSHLNETLIKWLVDYNYPGVTSYPKLETYAGRKPDLQARSTIDKALAADIGLPMPSDYLYETYGIPKPQNGDDLVNIPPKTPQGGPGFPGMDNGGVRFAEAHRGMDEGRKLPEMMTEQLHDSAEPHLDRMITQVRDLVMRAGSMEEIRDGLLDLYPDMDALKLGTLMQRAFAAAELAGRADEKEGA